MFVRRNTAITLLTAFLCSLIFGIAAVRASDQTNAEVSTESTEHVESYNKGNTLFRARKFTAAIEEYARAVELKPDYAEAFWAMGLCYNNMRNKQKAIDSFSKAIDSQPSYAKAYSARGSVYLSDKKFPAAINDYKKATEFNPRNEKNHFKLGFAYASSGMNQSAIKSYNRAIQWNDGYSKAYYNLGDCYSKTGNLSKAAWAYENAARTKSGYYKAYFKLTEVKKARKDFPGAERAVKKCLELRPAEAGALVLYGEILEGRGKPGAAMVQYKKAFDDPTWGPTAKYKFELIKSKNE